MVALLERWQRGISKRYARQICRARSLPQRRGPFGAANTVTWPERPYAKFATRGYDWFVESFGGGVHL